MIQPDKKLTIVLKAYSVLALLYTVYSLINIAIFYVNIQGMPLLTHILNAEKLVTFAVSILMVWIIFTNRPAAALFLPCIALGIVSALVLLGFFMHLMNIDETFNMGPYTFWYIVNAIVFLLIAVDARYGSKHALAELIALAALIVLQAIAGLVSLIRILGISSNATAYIPAQIAIGTLRFVLSPRIVITLFLLRFHMNRKNEAPPC
ncbi:MAG: hypothetical protein GX936_00835 [Clostridiales bacterium]|jgi:hypothetical protein|nr:hypothetical protein [Clostridiales bacterium]